MKNIIITFLVTSILFIGGWLLIDNFKSDYEYPYYCGNISKSNIYQKEVKYQLDTSLHFKVNFYLVSNDPNKVYLNPVEEIDKLNKAYDHIIFEADSVFFVYSDYTLDDAYNSAKATEDLRVNGKDSMINLFYLPSTPGSALLGFTPIVWEDSKDFSKGLQGLEDIFISYSSTSTNTIVHEMGHFFGLKHNFLDCTNYMNYNCFTDHFNPDQIKYMNYFAYNFRQYLK